MIFSFIVLILCNLFLINFISILIIEQENKEKNEKDDLLLAKISILSVILLLIIEFKINFFMFLIIILSLITNFLITGALDLKTINKIKILNKNITEKIMKLGVKIIPVCIIICYLLK